MAASYQIEQKWKAVPLSHERVAGSSALDADLLPYLQIESGTDDGVAG